MPEPQTDAKALEGKSESRLCAVDIKAGYDKVMPEAISGISLRLGRGQVMALAGPNGCGKSTLIKVMARQLKPSAGRIELDGEDIYSLRADAFARRVAYVPQSVDFSNQLTVEELVRLGRNPHQKWWSWAESEDDREATQKALVRAGMEELRKRPFANLSGGEQKRALIACALAQEPSFILMDEPIAHLDFKHQLSLLTLISELKQKGIGILLVLHDLNMIDRVADEIAFLKPVKQKPSRLFAIGSKEETLLPGIVSEVFDVSVSVFSDGSRRKRHFAIDEIGD